MKKLIAFALGILLCFGMTGCNGSDGLIFAAPDGVPALAVVKSKNEAKELEGNKINYEILTGGVTALLARLSSGEADFAVAPINLCSTVFNKKGEYMLGGVVLQGMMYLVSSDDSISEWSDLLGETIYSMGLGGTPDATLRYILAQNDITVTDSPTNESVAIAYKEDAQSVLTGIIAGDIRHAVLSEPLCSKVLAMRQEFSEIFDMQVEWGKASGSNQSYPQVGLLIKTSIVRDNPLLAQAVINETRASVEWAKSNMKQAGSMAAEQGSISLNAVDLERAEQRIDLAFYDSADCKQSVMAYLEVLFGFNTALVGGKLPDADAFFI